MNITWLASYSACCFHTVRAMIDGREIIDTKLTAAMQASADLLVNEIEQNSWPKQSLLEHLHALSCTIDSNRELAETTLIKVVGRNTNDSHIDPLTRCITAIENDFRKAVPSVLEELELRLGPLKMQFEAVGPGLLKAIATITDEMLITSDAKIVLVHPILGGAGTAHLQTNCVSIEAVLTNVDDRLPEVMRLAWLLSQLNLDLPMFSENLRPQTRELISALAMIPPVLTAANNIDLIQLEPADIQRAISAWHLEKNCPPNTAETLLSWWKTYQASRPRWPVAIGALEKMLIADG